MFEGSNVAIVTPFTDEGDIDYVKFGELIEIQIAQGTSGIVPCGTTGESATLSEEEHQKVIEFAIRTVNRRVPVIAGTGSNATDTAIELTKNAKAAGADGALVITPYYNKPTQEGLYQHFRAIATSVDIPIVLYNVPGRTGVNMAPETTARLANEFDNIVALKDATGSISQVSQTIHLVAKDDFTVLSGEDSIVFPLLAVGGKGVISVIANIAPSSMSELVAAFNEGNIERARELHYKQLPLCKAMFYETNPAPVKTALGLMNKCNCNLRLPMVPLCDSNRAAVRKALEDFGLL